MSDDRSPVPRRVLCVGPEADLRALATDGSALDALDVVLAPDVRSALRAFEQEAPDAVVLDFQVEAEQAVLDFLRRVRRTRLGLVVPIVVLSAGDKRVRGTTDAVLHFDVDEYVEKPVPTDWLLFRLMDLLGGRTLGTIQSPEGPAPERPVAVLSGSEFQQGNLADTDAAALLFSFAAASRSGKLVAMRGKHVKQMWFQRGCLVAAESNIPGEGFGEWLRNRRLVTADQVQVAATEALAAERTLGVLLVAHGRLPARRMLKELRDNTLDIVDTFLSWTDGHYYAEYMLDPADAAPPVPTSVLVDLGAIVVEGVRRHYRPERARALLATAEGPFRPARGSHFILRSLPDPYEYENLLSQVDPRRPAKELLKTYPFQGANPSCPMLYGLWAVGAVLEQPPSSAQTQRDPVAARVREAVAAAARDHARTARPAPRPKAAVAPAPATGPGGVATIMTALDRVSAEVAFENGFRLFSLRQYEQAARAFEEAARLAPPSTRLLLLLAQSHLLQENPGPDELERAVQAARRAVGLDPDQADAYHWLGLALLRLGFRDEARMSLRRAVDLGSALAHESRMLLDGP